MTDRLASSSGLLAPSPALDCEETEAMSEQSRWGGGRVRKWPSREETMVAHPEANVTDVEDGAKGLGEGITWVDDSRNVP